MKAVESLGQHVGVRTACLALNVHRSAYYRYRQPPPLGPVSRPPPSLKLSAEERQRAHETLLSERFVDQAPASVVATLLDEGTYLCSERTLYRILAENDQLKERRRGHRQVHYAKPELLAKNPNEVWSWDITKLKGPTSWSYFSLYVRIQKLIEQLDFSYAGRINRIIPLTEQVVVSDILIFDLFKCRRARSPQRIDLIEDIRLHP